MTLSNLVVKKSSILNFSDSQNWRTNSRFAANDESERFAKTKGNRTRMKEGVTQQARLFCKCFRHTKRLSGVRAFGGWRARTKTTFLPPLSGAVQPPKADCQQTVNPPLLPPCHCPTVSSSSRRAKQPHGWRKQMEWTHLPWLLLLPVRVLFCCFPVCEFAQRSTIPRAPWQKNSPRGRCFRRHSLLAARWNADELRWLAWIAASRLPQISWDWKSVFSNYFA